jgi:hypothetical protein
MLHAYWLKQHTYCQMRTVIHLIAINKNYQQLARLCRAVDRNKKKYFKIF